MNRFHTLASISSNTNRLFHDELVAWCTAWLSKKKTINNPTNITLTINHFFTLLDPSSLTLLTAIDRCNCSSVRWRCRLLSSFSRFGTIFVLPPRAIRRITIDCQRCCAPGLARFHRARHTHIHQDHASSSHSDRHTALRGGCSWCPIVFFFLS